MSERVFRFILGATLILLLFLNQEQAIYIYIAVLLFEGITNLRVPLLVSQLRYGQNSGTTAGPPDGQARIPFEAERTLRLIVAALLLVSYVSFHEQLWFLPWFIGFMLFMAGMTNICPMVMGLRWVGFR
jgi:hypothetical protein